MAALIDTMFFFVILYAITVMTMSVTMNPIIVEISADGYLSRRQMKMIIGMHTMPVVM